MTCSPAHGAPGDIVADRAYDASAVLDRIAARGGRSHIPPQRDRKIQRSVDPAFHRQRNLVERVQHAEALPDGRNPP